MYEFKKDPEITQPAMSDVATDVISIIVRVLGFALLLAGLWIAILVMLEALEIYNNPKKIDRLAVYIEQGSNIDKSLVSLRDITNEEEAQQDSDKSADANPSGNSNIRVSYFFAWIIAILMLMLIARISLTAIKTGGELVLYDIQIKRFARQLARESMRAPK